MAVLKRIQAGKNRTKIFILLVLASCALMAVSCGGLLKDTTPAPASTAAPAAASLPAAQNASEFEKEVFRLTNNERKAKGLKPLLWHDTLASISRAHSADMAARKFFSHTSPDGLTPFDRMKKAGITYRKAAENIAQGQRTPAEVVKTWMNSSGHKANILSRDLTHLGVGFHNYYWTQKFIGQ